ncbi:MAG: hypothetical protein JSR59_27450 [Proteobacteria bacterium]|nr:hypothetical protein [Pseudomonadota bacterium]
MVAIGDPSIFINSMMRYPGNRALARNLAAYLLDAGGEHKHDAKLTIVHDHFKERGSLGGGVTGSIRDRLRGFFSAVDGVRREGFGGIASRVVALGIAVAAAIWVVLRAMLRSKIPRPRYAGEDPEALTVARGLDDPRLSSLLARGGRRLFGSRPKPTSAGLSAVHEALDAAVAAREDLASLPRAQGVAKLATEAGLSAPEVQQVEKAFTRLRNGIGAAAVGGRAGAALSRSEAALFGRVLAPIADSLRSAR